MISPEYHNEMAFRQGSVYRSEAAKLSLNEENNIYVYHRYKIIKMSLSDVFIYRPCDEEVDRIKKLINKDLGNALYYNDAGTFVVFYRDMIEALARKLIDVQAVRVEGDSRIKNLQIEILNSTQLLTTEQSKNEMSEYHLKKMQNNSIVMRQRLDLLLDERDNLQEDLDNEAQAHQITQIEFEVEKAAHQKQKEDNAQLKRTVEEQDAAIEILKAEKLDLIEDFNLKIQLENEGFSNDKAELLEEMRQIRMENRMLLTMLHALESRSNSKVENSSNSSYDESSDFFST